MSYFIIFGIFMFASWIIGEQLKSRFKKYSKIPNNSNMSGKEVAEKMLRDHEIYNVSVISVQGQLTDHYNPIKRTVNLSNEVYSGRHIAAAAIAAHECGHAVQHAKSYAFLQFRSALVPVVSFTSKWVQWVLLAGILTITVFPALLLLGIVLFAFTTLFSFITLPVEIDASNRALKWLNYSGITNIANHDKAKDALKWAAYTYVVAALASLATLMYYVMIFMSRRD